MNDAAQSVASACIHEAQQVLKRNRRKIGHCLDQLDDEQVNWRPFEPQNSIANIILHLCGNVRQWLIAGIGETPDTRNRQGEFDDRNRYTRAELLQRLDQTLQELDQVLARLTAQSLLGARRIQGFEETGMSALWHSICHFEGHTHEIVYITRLQIRERYRFLFVPKTKEQGAPV
jgi:uncharacterized damage-inducible protein DinB